MKGFKGESRRCGLEPGSFMIPFSHPIMLSPPFPFDLPMAGADAARQPWRGDSCPPLMCQVRGATQVIAFVAKTTRREETPVDHAESSSSLIRAAANMQTPEKLD